MSKLKSQFGFILGVSIVMIGCSPQKNSKLQDLGLSPSDTSAPQSVLWYEGWNSMVHMGICPANTITPTRRCSDIVERAAPVSLMDYEQRLRTRVLGERIGRDPVSSDDLQNRTRFLEEKIKRLKISLQENSTYDESANIKAKIASYENELLMLNQWQIKPVVYDSSEEAKINGILGFLQMDKDLVLDAGRDLYLLAKAAFDSDFAMISAGANHTCAIASNRKLYCWGSGISGQIGNGSDLSNRLQPVAVGNSEMDYSSVAAGESHTCALTPDGRAFCWGDNRSGQLGEGSQETRLVPTEVHGGMRFTSLSVGLQHSCGLSGAGEAYCWGEGANGQLGDGRGEKSLEPVKVIGNLILRQLSAGGKYNCGLTAKGEAYCWGLNNNGQLGSGKGSQSLEPQLVSGDLHFNSLSAGDEHTCALSSESQAYCWGSGYKGRLGTNYANTVTRYTDDSQQPILVSGKFKFSKISAGKLHTCGITDIGQALCWGFGRDGRLGTGGDDDRVEPTEVRGYLNFSSISTGGSHTCGLLSNGSAYCWGDDSQGQLGIKKEWMKNLQQGNSEIPVLVDVIP